MKRLFIVIFACLLSVCSYSQEHITFNGATFGKSLNEFIKDFPPKIEKNTISHPPKGFNYSLCNCNEYWINLNSYKWECHIFSSKTTNTVFRTICVNSFMDLENQLMLLVKSLEEKYGGGVQEKQENLGEIGYLGSNYREMLALYYYVKGTNNKRIGEIRISCAPSSKDGKSGYIELSYTDYKSRDKATAEYNSTMRNSL